jgi:hypothetical protein
LIVVTAAAGVAFFQAELRVCGHALPERGDCVRLHYTDT